MIETTYMLEAEARRGFLQVGFSVGNYEVRRAHILHGQRSYLTPAFREVLTRAARRRRAQATR